MDYSRVAGIVAQMLATERLSVRVRQALLMVQEAIEQERLGTKYSAVAQMGVFLADALAEIERLQALVQERDVRVVEISKELDERVVQVVKLMEELSRHELEGVGENHG